MPKCYIHLVVSSNCELLYLSTFSDLGSFSGLCFTESRIGQSPPGSSGHDFLKPLTVIAFPLIEPENLFVNVTLEVPRHHADVRAVDAPLEQRPEVFNPVRVTVTANVLLGVVDHFVNELVI